MKAFSIARLIALACVLTIGIAVAGHAPTRAAEPVLDWSGRDPAIEKSAGALVYRQNCAACHDAGLNRAPQRFNLADMTPEAIHRALTEGSMREQGTALSADQKLAVSEYISGRKFGSASVGEANLCKGAAADFDMKEPPAFSGWGLDPAGTHAIPAKISGLSKASVGRLKLKWAFGFPNSSRARSRPAVAGGAIFVGNHNGSVYALDRETGCVRWVFAAHAEVRTGIVVSPWRAGEAAARPLVYFGDIAGNAYAVNMRDGKPAWRVHTDDHPATILTGTPTLWQGTLYVPVSSNEEAFATSPNYACCNFRGSVVAYDARDGREKWRTYLVDPATKQGTAAAGQDKLGPSGVAVWNAPAIDAKRGQLYVATADNYSLPTTGLSDAVVALDLATGKIRWEYQALAGDAWNVACVTKTSDSCPDEDAPDADFGAGTVLAKAKDGREFVLAGQKSGWVYGLDPDTGKLSWKTRVGRGSPAGGVHFGMAADGGVLFVPITDNAFFGPTDHPASPGVYALDIGNGAFVWKAPSTGPCADIRQCFAGYGGAIAATSGMVLTGADDSHLRIFDAANGKMLWDFDTQRDFTTVNGVAGRGGAIAGGNGPIAYRSMVIVPSGYGFASKTKGNVLLVFDTK